MKKFAKVSAIAAAIMIVLGGVLLAVAGVNGGFKSVAQMVLGGELSWNLGAVHISLWENDSLIYVGNRAENVQSGEKNYEMPIKTETSEIHSLSIQAGGGNIRFLPGNADSISIRCNQEGYKVYEENGTLYIEEGGISIDFFGIHSMTVATMDLDIYIPQDMKFHDVTLEIGAGDVELGNLTTDDLQISIGAASLNADNLTVNNELDIELGAGEVVLENAILNYVETEIGAGSVELTGRIAGDCTVDVAMGSAELELYGKEEEHNYKIDCALGTVTLGNESYEGLASEKTIQNGADNTYDLSCAMGELSVEFIGE